MLSVGDVDGVFGVPRAALRSTISMAASHVPNRPVAGEARDVAAAMARV